MKEVIFKLPDEVLALIVHKVANTPQEASLLEKWIYDGEERKTGKWKKRLLTTEPFTIYGYDCPFCEFRTATNSFNFCPNCGAKMEVDDEDIS